jgi:hypothetical protein
LEPINQQDNCTNIDFKQISLNLRRRTYKYIGSGSGRVVFDLGNQYVVKAARNKKGIGQNEAEYKIALADKSELFAKIPCVSDGYRLLIMEKAEKVRDISFVWKYFNVKNNKELFQLEEFQDISSTHHLLLRDFGRHVNWGKINGRPVIIDYGFTKEVFKKYF